MAVTVTPTYPLPPSPLHQIDEEEEEEEEEVPRGVVMLQVLATVCMALKHFSASFNRASGSCVTWAVSWARQETAALMLAPADLRAMLAKSDCT